MNFGFQSGGGGETPPIKKIYGSFYEVNQQVASAINIPQAMELGSTANANLFTIQNNILGKPTRIFTKGKGLYNLQFSAQLDKLAGGTSEDIVIWIAVNGNSVPDTATKISLANNNRLLTAAWNWYVALPGNSYVEIIWLVTDLSIVLRAFSSTPVIPAIPSVIATIEQVE